MFRVLIRGSSACSCYLQFQAYLPLFLTADWEGSSGTMHVQVLCKLDADKQLASIERSDTSECMLSLRPDLMICKLIARAESVALA